MDKARPHRGPRLRTVQQEMFRSQERWVRDVVEGNALKNRREVPDETGPETFDRLRRLGLLVATMGAGKTLTIVLELLAQTPVALSRRTMDKRLIMCYNVAALKNFADELQFEQRCPLHTRRGFCEECMKAQDLAIGKSKLVRIVGLEPAQVKTLSRHVYFLSEKARDVTNPNSESEDALKFRSAWIVVSTQQIWKAEYLRRTLTINLDSSQAQATPETVRLFLEHAVNLLSEAVPADAVSLDLPVVGFSTSSLSDRLGMSDELHEKLCEHVFEALEHHGRDVDVDLEVKTAIAAKEALPLMCAAVWWAVTPHEREPIKLELIGWDNRLCAHDVGFDIEFDIDDPEHRSEVLKNEETCNVILEKTVKCFVDELVKKRRNHGFLQAIVCGPMQLEEGDRCRLSPLRKLKELFDSTVTRLVEEGRKDWIRPDGRLRVEFVHTGLPQADIHQIRDRYINGDIDIIINFNMLNVGFGIHMTDCPSVRPSVRPSVCFSVYACVVCRLPHCTRSPELAHVRVG